MDSTSLLKTRVCILNDSRCIAGRCDWIVFRETIQKAKEIPEYIYLNLSEGNPGGAHRDLHGASKTFCFFMNSVLATLTSPFTLVVGTADFTFPFCLYDCRYPKIENIDQHLKTLFSNTFFRKAFVENLDTDHLRFEPIPLGILGPVINDIEHIKDIPSSDKRDINLFLCHRSRPDEEQFSIRKHVDEVSKQWNVSNYTRIISVENSDVKTGVGFGIDKKEYIEYLKRSRFCICTTGGGLDPCPKAWEAIAMGCIPIIKTSTMDRVWRKLPVIIVNKWDKDTITEEKLDRWYSRLKDEHTEPRRSENIKMLTNEYWFNFIKESSMKPVEYPRFIHITKTAGTAIEDCGKKYGINWGRHDQLYMNNTLSPGGVRWHKRLDVKNKLDTLSKFKWFAVVRNPYTRVLSEILWIRQSKFGSNHSFTNDVEMNSLIRFYLDKVKTNQNFDKVIDVHGNHFTPQHTYISKQLNIHVLKFENLANEFSKLMKQYDLDIHLEKSNSTNKGGYSVANFDKETVALIQEVYREDFKRFGYTI